MQNDTSPFYLGINHSKKGKAVTWYKNMPMGEGKLRTLMKTAATKANITDKKLTNHSGQKKKTKEIAHVLDGGSSESVSNSKGQPEQRSESPGVPSTSNQNNNAETSQLKNSAMLFPQGTVINGGNFNFNFGNSTTSSTCQDDNAAQTMCDISYWISFTSYFYYRLRCLGFVNTMFWCNIFNFATELVISYLNVDVDQHGNSLGVIPPNHDFLEELHYELHNRHGAIRVRCILYWRQHFIRCFNQDRGPFWMN
ncbi:unnamed protein product [Mytilus edulis]|uniref:Uncharacterized protein n=1 Tax=Mytilus edulis TaxID=6550 RepID=A0A8S3T685_MYTED|nr:unnamed protein product [Mytilus edulis]